MYVSKTILFLAGLLIVLFILFTCNYFNPAPVQGGPEKVDTLQWVNNAGDIATSLKADPSYFAEERKKLIDSISKVYKTAPKKVIEYVIANTEGNIYVDPYGAPAPDYFPVDSNKKDCPPVQKNIVQNFSSPYYKAKVQIGDSSYMQLRAFDTITMLWKKVNEGSIFNRKRLIQLDISTANPDTKVTGIKAYRFYEKPKKWAIGFGIGYGLPLTQKQAVFVPMISLSVQKTLIKF